MTDATEAQALRPSRMEGREQLASAVLAALAPLGFVVGLWPLAGRDLTFLAIGVALAGVLAVGARLENRIVAGIGATLLFSGPWGDLSILGGPYIALAFLLLFRLSRANGMKARQQREARRATAPRTRARATTRPTTPSKRVTPPGTRPQRRRR